LSPVASCDSVVLDQKNCGVSECCRCLPRSNNGLPRTTGQTPFQRIGHSTDLERERVR
jgi:hypothetical protein